MFVRVTAVMEIGYGLGSRNERQIATEMCMQRRTGGPGSVYLCLPYAFLSSPFVRGFDSLTSATEQHRKCQHFPGAADRCDIP